MMNRRTELMKMIANADDKGIDRIYDLVNNGCACKKMTTDQEIFKKVCSEVFADIMLENPTNMLIAAEIVEAFVRLEIKLFKED